MEKLGLLTSREKEVFELIKIGMSDKEISEKLNITVRTASSHVGRILFKYNIHDRKKLVFSRDW